MLQEGGVAIFTPKYIQILSTITEITSRYSANTDTIVKIHPVPEELVRVGIA